MGPVKKAALQAEVALGNLIIAAGGSLYPEEIKELERAMDIARKTREAR